MTPESHPYKLFRPGDLNAFFGLMLDNLTQLVILSGILIGVFGYPAELVLTRMVPGSAVGVLIGDLFYTRMAVRLAKKTGRADVTAMPLGIDTVSLFAYAFGILGPAYLATNDAALSWKIGMAVIVLAGAVKAGLSFFTPHLRRIVPRAGLLGPIAAIAILLIAFFPSLKIFHHPVVGFLSLAIILVGLIGHVRLPLGIPAAFGGIAAGSAAYYVFWAAGWIESAGNGAANHAWTLALPWPTLGFLQGLPEVGPYLALAIPFAIVIVIGGTDVTESAAAGGDEYNTRDIVLADGVATILAGLCGGVVQTTPYIGQPAYKDMGGGAGYTLATGLFIGLGGMLGLLSMVVNWIPEAAVAPILIFIGVEIMAQSFSATPQKHHKAVAITFLPSIAYLVLIQINGSLGNVGSGGGHLTGESALSYHAVLVLANGFIITSLLWGAARAKIIDRELKTAGYFLLSAGACSLFGVIHSPYADGRLFLPWRADTNEPVTMGIAYGVMAGVMLLWDRSASSPAAPR
jgi:AGZA family xanthine/uracil permease-like MFS transporter